MDPGCGLNLSEKRKICCTYRDSSVLITRYSTPGDLNFVTDMKNSNFTLTSLRFDIDFFFLVPPNLMLRLRLVTLQLIVMVAPN